MKLFLSHASEDKSVAESIAFSLRSRGHKVFLDRDDLPPGQSYDQQIERAVKESDAFIFLISPHSVAPGRYTLTELSFARRKWQDPQGRVLPVIAKKTPLDDVPSYLKAVTILEPLGNITAETSAAVDDLGRAGHARALAWKFAGVGALAGLIAGCLPIFNPSLFALGTVGYLSSGLLGKSPMIRTPAPDVGLVLALLLAIGMYRWVKYRRFARLAFMAVVVSVLWSVSVYGWLYSSGVPGKFLPNLFSVGDVDSEKLKTALDPEQLDLIRNSVASAAQLKSGLGFVLALLLYAGSGLLFSVLCLIALPRLLGIDAKRFDYFVSAIAGVIGGSLFMASIAMYPFEVEPWFKLDIYNGAAIATYPNLMLAFMFGLAPIAASIGHWLGRNAD